MYQAEVNNTQQYSDSQGKHIVCKGKLILLRNKDEEIDANSFGQKREVSYVRKPIIISETEEIIGTKVLFMPPDGRRELHDVQDYREGRYEVEDPVRHIISEKSTFKVLALPEHFSDKHLQAIVDGKIKDGDEVLVKCDMGNYWGNIHLDQNNHITLFPAKQSLEEAAFNYADSDKQIDETSHLDYHEMLQEVFKAGAEWAKKNNF